jgi:hypothetical protein
MSEPTIPHAYEVAGLRDTGETFIVEILGVQTDAAALMLAQHYADLWQHTVNLCVVPFERTGSEAWTEDQMQVVQQLPPTRRISCEHGSEVPRDRDAALNSAAINLSEGYMLPSFRKGVMPVTKPCKMVKADKQPCERWSVRLSVTPQNIEFG